MKTEFLYIFIVAFIQGGGYDFAGWYGILKEQTGHKREWLFRVIKEILDFVVTPVILIVYLNWNAELVTAFYILKWFGWCDGFYILMWKIFNPKRNYTEEGIWWMWWTPLGLVRSQLVYRGTDPLPAKAGLPLSGGDVYYFHLYKRWWFKKGVISLKEFYWQLGVGLVLSYVVYHFEVITNIYKFIF